MVAESPTQDTCGIVCGSTNIDSGADESRVAVGTAAGPVIHFDRVNVVASSKINLPPLATASICVRAASIVVV